jgi:hypothetical protein
MNEQLRSRRAALDPNYDPELPLALPGSTPHRPAVQPVQAGGGGQSGSRAISNAAGSSTSNLGLEPASGPQRRTPSTRESRDQANISPARRPRISLPSDCQTFDVVFLPFKFNVSVYLTAIEGCINSETVASHRTSGPGPLFGAALSTETRTCFSSQTSTPKHRTGAQTLRLPGEKFLRGQRDNPSIKSSR